MAMYVGHQVYLKKTAKQETSTKRSINKTASYKKKKSR